MKKVKLGEKKEKVISTMDDSCTCVKDQNCVWEKNIDCIVYCSKCSICDSCQQMCRYILINQTRHQENMINFEDSWNVIGFKLEKIKQKEYARKMARMITDMIFMADFVLDHILEEKQ